ncbi:ParA family protein [Ferruginibacter sp.]|nr:AAA family ATPase [Ferruginibacter sp.]
MKKIALYNIKGGVGKTTTTVNLACMLAKQGLSVLLWDMDPQGGSSYFFNRENHNDNTHGKLFDRYITIYDVIHSTDTYQIDVISNDSKFSDQFMNKAARITALNFINHDLISSTLNEVEDDYDVCIIDCSPGRFLLHDNIFNAADLLLIPNIPAPLSVYCNNMLIKELQAKKALQNKILSFYNMVQVNKSLHKFYLDNKTEDAAQILNSFIPFYSEIENISLKKESIFHQLKEFKTITYYEKLWLEICDRMQWHTLNTNKAVVVDINEEQKTSPSSVIDFNNTDLNTKTSNG